MGRKIWLDGRLVDEADAKGDLTGWVTLSNQSGASYENAKLKLVAGDVNRVSAGPSTSRGAVPSATPLTGLRWPRSPETPACSPASARRPRS